MPRRGAAARLERALQKSFPQVDDAMFDTRLRDDVIDQHEEERGDVWGKTFHQGLRGRQGGGLEAESKSGVKVKSPSQSAGGLFGLQTTVMYNSRKIS